MPFFSWQAVGFLQKGMNRGYSVPVPGFQTPVLVTALLLRRIHIKVPSTKMRYVRVVSKRKKQQKSITYKKKKKKKKKPLQNQNGPTFYPPVTGPVNTWQFSANSHDCCSSEWPPPPPTHTHIKSLDDRLITAESWSHCCFSGLLTAPGHPAVSEHWAVWISSTPA